MTCLPGESTGRQVRKFELCTISLQQSNSFSQIAIKSAKQPFDAGMPLNQAAQEAERGDSAQPCPQLLAF
jgi:hypothetical protein